jgi:hypothetical protein
MNSSNNFENTTFAIDEATVRVIMKLGEILEEEGQEGLSKVTRKPSDADDLNRGLEHVQKCQAPILYSFNEKNGIKFPGYFSLNDETLNPNLVRTSIVEWGSATQYFYTAPEDFKRWAETVGLSYHPTGSININIRISEVIEKEISSSEAGCYYSARLTKNVSPTGFQEHHSGNSAYLELINFARNIDNALKQLHARKKFEIKGCFPYFGITDLRTQERYSGALPSTTPIAKHGLNKGQQLWNEIFKNNNLKAETREERVLKDESVIIAVYMYGLHALKVGNIELATAAFTMGADLKNPLSLMMLQKMGTHPYKKPAS